MSQARHLIEPFRVQERVETTTGFEDVVTWKDSGDRIRVRVKSAGINVIERGQLRGLNITHVATIPRGLTVQPGQARLVNDDVAFRVVSVQESIGGTRVMLEEEPL